MEKKLGRYRKRRRETNVSSTSNVQVQLVRVEMHLLLNTVVTCYLREAGTVISFAVH